MKEFRFEYTDIGLPKWPQILVWGQPVTPAQAMEIIRRTDSLLVHGWGGNDREFDRRALEIVRRPDLDDYEVKDWPRYDREHRQWARAWGIIDTEFVRNSWLSSAFIYGPNGWCHPDGIIFKNDNIGKYPSGDDVLREWTVLARAFPFLDLEVVLMSGEDCEWTAEPCIIYEVYGGRAWAVPPDATKPFERFGKTLQDVQNFRKRNLSDAMALVNTHPSLREHAFGLDIIQRWADDVFGKLNFDTTACSPV